ncbi:PilZ domain-containing protein [Kushneria sinocarnis]|uniref:PilZ domain-containing protein n=1 Tax=Kushneria sinocarnis TaxID=595502 RepID=A0A420WTS1_9GAMM|nr:PilZ domain-containing protein [Kushneria sinocarnis]RKQ96281.1 PilZ domain-containing protein [Kushneria sinocarnis]
MSQPRHGVIDNADAIADLFVELTRNAHEITLRFDATPVHYPVSVVSIDRIHAGCLLDVTSLGDIDQLLAEERCFMLHARQEALALRSSPMQVQRTVERAGRLGVYCTLPRQLRFSRQRSYFRAALSEGMEVMVELAAADGRCWRARLCDLSIGGCLLALPAEAAASLPALETRLQVRAHFPNGEVFEASSRLCHLHTDQVTVQLGIGFDIGLAVHERRVWFYVREIERESVRQQRGASATRPLAPSRLFQPAPDESEGPASAS